jgi:hypothetical protein
MCVMYDIVCVCVCVLEACVCVCGKEDRERERENVIYSCALVYLGACVPVCLRPTNMHVHVWAIVREGR